jgi:glycosyltransferase involved in cell wall biosynthesis
MTLPAEERSPAATAGTEKDNRPPVFMMIESLETGGSERQFAALAGALDQSSFRLLLGCIRRTGPFLERMGDVEAFPLGGSLYGMQSWRTRLRLARHLKKTGALIAHSFDFYTNLTMIPAARLAGVPVVIGSQRQLGDLLTRAQYRTQLQMFKWCDLVVCNSQAAAARLVEDGLSENKITVIGNGLPPEAFAGARAATPRTGGILRVGMISRMNASYKNHRCFLRAAVRLAPRFPGVEFVLVGDGPLRTEFERLAAEWGIADRVRFLGDRRDIPAVLATLDVTVLPSDSESLSNVVLESMAAGVPVVASGVGGNVELLSGERGILVRRNDDEELAAAVERLLVDPALRAKLADAAKGFVQANFAITRVRECYEAVYREQLARKGWHAAELQGPVVNASRATRVRVAVVAPSLRWVGGQAVQADLLLRNWKDDPDVEACFIPADPRFPPGMRWIERIPFLRTLVRQPLYCWKLWRGLKDVEVAHIFSASYWSFLLAPAPAWLVARLRGTKTLINYRSGEARDHLRRFRSASFVLRRADFLVTPSGYLVDVFREFGLQAQAVPNLVDLSQFSFRSRNPLRPHLVCTRGFHRYYRVDIVVRAFAEVRKLYPDAQLDLVGGGPLEEEVRALVAQLNLSGVHFAGVASRDEIGRHYDRADIFINASCLDNMPVSVLEAFASGTPVVSTAPEGMRYLVEDGRTGLLSEPGDAQALARNVIRLLREPELASQLILNAFEQSKRYRWDVVREQWLEVYRSLAGSRPGVASAENHTS